MLIALAMVGCDALQPGMNRDMEGTYVKAISSEYSTGSDTLEISAISRENNNYQINRKSNFQRVVRGRLAKPEQKSERWIAIYDPGQKILKEVTKGKILSFIPEKNMLLVGKSVYHKTKD